MTMEVILMRLEPTGRRTVVVVMVTGLPPLWMRDGETGARVHVVGETTVDEVKMTLDRTGEDGGITLV
jgi:hypothetical protein